MAQILAMRLAEAAGDLANTKFFFHLLAHTQKKEDGNLVLSNNLAERSIKSFVMGRKNWLFSQSFEGAQSSSIIMTLLKTAKRNELDAKKYINYLLTHMPNENILEKNDVLEAYLPWNEIIQETCK